ncbi:hypothetical protein ABW20_dc0102325 [Dactylellina cionopaga]|nr:hypothetical protein ABW20_dc0102325 [Dactylellina cionopaga]
MSSKVKKQKASKGPELELLKDRILSKYYHENWTISRVVEYFNEAYNLNYTPNQYYYLIQKSGGRKYMHEPELARLGQMLQSRDDAGKADSLVVLGNNTTISMRSSERRLKRLTFTQRIMADKPGSCEARPILKWFLELGTAPTLAACTNILPVLYIRGDKELINWVRQLHPDLDVDLYKFLDCCVRQYSYSGIFIKDNENFFNKYSEFWSKMPETAESGHFSIHTPFVIRHLRETKTRPKTVYEAQLLLFACKAVLGDLEAFDELWDDQQITATSMEKSDNWTKQFRLLPLFSDNANHIECAINGLKCGGYFRDETECLDFNYPMRIWGRITVSNSLRILRAAFELEVKPATIKLWPSIWKHFWERGRHHQKHDAELITTFLNARVDINGPIDFQYGFEKDSPSLAEAQICKPAIKIGFGDRTPLALALYLTRPYLFNFVLSQDAKIDQTLFSQRKEEVGGKAREFLDAVQNKDYVKIGILWEARLSILGLEPPIDPRMIHQEGGFMELAHQIFDSCRNISGTRKRKLWSFVEYTAKLKSNDEHYKGCLDLVRYLVNPHDNTIGENARGNSYSVIQERFDDAEAKLAINKVIYQNKPDLLEVLIKCPAGVQLWNPPTHVEKRFFDQSVAYSLNCLKLLIKLGITIGVAEELGSRPFRHPIEINNTDMIEYLLAEGAKIDKEAKVWTGSASVVMSALEQAVYQRKVDIVTLFLEFYPDCYNNALAAAESFERPILEKSIRDWKNAKDNKNST